MPYCTAIPALADNYIWLIRESETTKDAYIVDPGEAKPVLDCLENNQLNLAGILLTHHHRDHIGGVGEIVNKHSVPVYGPSSIDCVTRPVKHDDSLELNGLTESFQVIAIPGHTLEHIAYYTKNALFCGDTLFAGGCGRIFEGTPEQMLNSLHTLANLPEHTRVYCAHEYTLANLKFAALAEPQNSAINKQVETVTQLLSKTACSLPSTLAIEKKVNPFLRCAEVSVAMAASEHASKSLTSELAVFTEIRSWKNEI